MRNVSFGLQPRQTLHRSTSYWLCGRAPSAQSSGMCRAAIPAPWDTGYFYDRRDFITERVVHYVSNGYIFRGPILRREEVVPPAPPVQT